MDGSINLLAIDQQYKIKGAKGTYVNIKVIETPDNQYGYSHMIVQKLPKEAFDRGERGAILGNLKSWNNQPRQPQQHEQAQYQEPDQSDPPDQGGNVQPAMNDDDIPF